MASILIAIITALAVGHLAPTLAASLRQFGWYRSWLQWLDAQFPEHSFWRGRFGLALALVLPLLAVGLLQFGLLRSLWGIPALLFAMVMLFWCWGPRDLDLDVAAILQAPDVEARRRAAAGLRPRDEILQLDGASLVDLVFRNARQRWFAVLFWFCLLGPLGAVLYRLSALAAEQESDIVPAATLEGARIWLAILDWPATQVMTLSLALVGNFDSVLAAWREPDAFGLRSRVLSSAARASVRCEIADEVADYTEAGISASAALAEAFGELPELRDAMSLVWRMLILWLAIMALFVVAGWAG